MCIGRSCAGIDIDIDIYIYVCSSLCTGGVHISKGHNFSPCCSGLKASFRLLCCAFYIRAPKCFSSIRYVYYYTHTYNVRPYHGSRFVKVQTLCTVVCKDFHRLPIRFT